MLMVKKVQHGILPPNSCEIVKISTTTALWCTFVLSCSSPPAFAWLVVAAAGLALSVTRKICILKAAAHEKSGQNVREVVRKRKRDSFHNAMLVVSLTAAGAVPQRGVLFCSRARLRKSVGIGAANMC